jgi:hypothetical protein
MTDIRGMNASRLLIFADEALRGAARPALDLARRRRQAYAARAFPEYAERHAGRLSDETVSTSLAETIQDLDAERSAPREWWESPVQFLSSNPFQQVANQCRWGIQRLIRGWDDRATWSLDVHLARTLGNQLLHLADSTHGWPHSDTYPEPQDWEEALRLHGHALVRYADGCFAAEDDTELIEAQKALRWVAENLPNLWD